MPVLTSPDVLPEAMRYITKVLLAQGGTTPKSELHRIIAPSGLQGAFQGSEQSEPGNKPGQIIVTNTLTAMASIGLVTYGRGDDADVTLVEEFADRLPKWDRLDDAAFASFFAQEAIDDRNLETESEDNRDADGSERGDGAADLVHALAMLMWMPDPLDPLVFEAGPGRKSLQDFQTKTLGPDIDDWLLRNRERFPNFGRWVTYLGFGRLDPGGALVADASRGMASFVTEAVGNGGPVAECIDRLGTLLPFTDRGPIGMAVREIVQPKYPPTDLSPGLSMAWMILARQGLITLALKDDASSLGFRIGPEQTVRYSHVEMAS